MSLTTRSFLAGLNHLLSSASWARERLASHAGRSGRLRAEPFEVVFSVQPDGYLAPAPDHDPPSVTLSLPLGAALGLAAGDAARTMSEVRIDGNAEFADTLGFVFRNLRWDAEEDLSKLFGDIAARRIVLAAKGLKTFHTQALDALGGNFAEYFTEEQKLLVTRRESSDHGRDVGQLRDDLARIEKRIEWAAERLAAVRRQRGGAAPTTAASRPPAGFLPLDEPGPRRT